MITVKEGSLWGSTEKKFRVLSVSEIEGHTWVHYREEKKKDFDCPECKEYSCYVESFVQRFNPLPE